MGRHQPVSEILPETVEPCYAFALSAVSALTVAATMITAHVHPLPDCPQIVQDGFRALHMGGAAATTAVLTTAALIAADNMVKEGRFLLSSAGIVVCELALIAEGAIAESGYTKAGALLAACIAPIIAGAVDLHRQDHEFFFDKIFNGRQGL
jgi:hypothetical protein